MALSKKQLAMVWIDQKLEPSRINPEDDELTFINGGPIKPEVLAGAKAFIFDELAKVKVRFHTYALKYGEVDDGSSDSDEGLEQQEERQGDSNDSGVSG